MTTSTPLPLGPPLAGTETETLLGALERVRRTFAWKCGGLDDAALQRTLPPSTMTLGGLLKHLALVEDDYFTRRLHGRDIGAPWNAVDWDADRDWEWRTAADDTADELMELWRRSVERSQAAIGEALADGGLDRLAQHTSAEGDAPSLRRMIIDIVEEYARHLGHADLLRESIDGLVGEDAPLPQERTSP